MRDERLSGHKRSVTCIQVLHMAGVIRCLWLGRTQIGFIGCLEDLVFEGLKAEVFRDDMGMSADLVDCYGAFHGDDDNDDL